MKKTLALLLGFIIFASSATAFVATELHFQGQDVRFTLVKEEGDRKYLDGIKCDIHFAHLDSLNWYTAFEPSGETKTKVTFNKTGNKDNYRPEYGGIGFYSYDVFDLKSSNESLKKEYSSRFMSELTEVGDQVTFSVKLKDYYDYYPLKLNVDLPDIHISYDFSPMIDSSGDYFFTGISEERGRGFIDALTGFLKIPTYENDLRIHTVQKTRTGNSYSSEFRNTFDFYGYNSVFSDKLYFTVNNKTEGYGNDESVILDTSEIPGGYGIYSVPYTDNDILYEEIKNEYPIASDSTALFLSGDNEKNLLFLSLEENGKYIFKIINSNTKEEISVLEVFDYTDNDYATYINYNDFIVFIKNDSEIAVAERKADGTYEIVIDYVLETDEESPVENFPVNSEYAFDGEKLVMLTVERGKYSAAKKTLYPEIFIYTKEGPVYYGKWDCSLGELKDIRRAEFCNEKDYSVSISE